MVLAAGLSPVSTWLRFLQLQGPFRDLSCSKCAMKWKVCGTLSPHPPAPPHPHYLPCFSPVLAQDMGRSHSHQSKWVSCWCGRGERPRAMRELVGTGGEPSGFAGFCAPADPHSFLRVPLHTRPARWQAWTQRCNWRRRSNKAELRRLPSGIL